MDFRANSVPTKCLIGYLVGWFSTEKSWETLESLLVFLFDSGFVMC